MATSEGVLSNDTDPEGDVLFATLVSKPTSGSLDLFPDGAFTYTPDSGFNGVDNFTYQPNDGAQTGNTATVTIRVVPQSNSPRISEGLVALYTFAEGTGTTVRDVSGVGEPLDLTIANITAVNWLPSGGLSIDAPAAIASPGAATKIIDALKASQAITIEAWVKPANTTQYGPARIVALSGDAYPTGGNFVLGAGVKSSQRATYDVRLRTTRTSQYGTPSLTSSNGTATTDLTHVLYTRDASGQNQLFIDGNLTAKGSTSGNFSNWGNYALGLGNEPHPELGDRPWLGTLHLVAIYDHALTENEIALNYGAGPTETYNEQDPEQSDSGSDQSVVNSLPLAADDAFRIAAGAELKMSATWGVLSNDSDPDGDALIAVLVGSSGPSSGSLVLNADGSFIYQPEYGFSGSDHFSYYAEDPLGEKEIAIVTINVDPPINSAPLVKNDTYTIEEDTELYVAASEGVLSNDSDPDGEALKALLVDTPQNGRLELFEDGSFSYMPLSGYSGSDSFTYKPSDTVNSGNTATVTISVKAAAERSMRVSEGLVALYEFKAGAGRVVRDVSGVGTPLDLNIIDPSAVSWKADGGLAIHASATIRSSGAATKIIEALKASQAITIEAWVKPANTTQYGPARIVALSGDAYPTGGNFVLGAGVKSSQRATYDVRLRTTRTSQYGIPSLTSSNGTVTTDLTHVLYTRDASGQTQLFIDGNLTAKGSTSGDFFNWGNYALGLGNEPHPELGDRPWLGTLYLVAIYDRALTFSEVLNNFNDR